MTTPLRPRSSVQRSISICAKVFFLIIAAVVLFTGFSAPAQACDKVVQVTGGILPAGNPQDPCDLEVTTGQVIVDKNSMPAAWGNVNIWGGGSLCFIDGGTNLDFWAKNILIENDGALTNGIDDGVNEKVRCILGAFGSKGGTLTIHLYGADQCKPGQECHGVGVTCKADADPAKNQCGIPDAIWDTNKMDMANMNPDKCTSSELPGLYGHVNDCFYQYGPLDFDDGKDANNHDRVGYFGYKVLAVSYGGRLKLYGTKGVSPMANNAPCKPGAACPQKADSGRSWGRLLGTVKPGATQLVLDRQVFWKAGDQIVLTTTDYIPGHSEQLTLKQDAAINGNTSTLQLVTPIQYDHNGETYDLTNVPDNVGPDADPNVKCTAGQKRCIETRAAIGLLTRSVRIVSGCDNYGEAFPDPGKKCDGTPTDDKSSYYFGGQVIARQGIDLFELSGVELKNMGEGGRIMHYPVHFHMARTVPLYTFVDDSSIWDSMNRWVTIHATQNLELARNVGYLSIGHGFYLEDGSESGNSLVANLGVMTRGAIKNAQNPRNVPGIFAAGRRWNPDNEEVPEHSDAEHPTTYWISNGENFFSYNVAAGVTTCGMCYWFLPMSNSGMSRYQHWEHYAAEQEYRVSTDPAGADDFSYAGTTPLASFTGNSCVSAQNSFITVGATAACKAVSDQAAQLGIVNPLAPDYPSLADKEHMSWTPYPEGDMYYPKIPNGGSRAATVCPINSDGSQCSTGKSYINPCAYNATSHQAEPGCAVTILDRYSSSFTWADTNVAALWLRKQWYLVTNSAITDAQNGGLTFVSGGGYTFADEIPGYWALAHKSVFVGNTQALHDTQVNGFPVGMPDNPFASNAGPFNPLGLKCVPILGNSVCPAEEQGIFFPESTFANNQRLFNIYDGPSYQSANAYMDITKTVLAGCRHGQGPDVCANAGWGNGLAMGALVDSTVPLMSGQECYLSNAAIAWKQPNGFYYPPAFRSNNLYFNYDKANPYRRVDIRHFVIEPLFDDVDNVATNARYCTFSGAITNWKGVTLGSMFQNWTDIDRQTELTDEDGSLTGLQGPKIGNFQMPTISVNKDPFFSVPIETTECSSDIINNMPANPLGGKCAFADDQFCGTANTSPYDYLTTVIVSAETDKWTKECDNQLCPGVSLYRQDLVMKNGQPETKPSLIRMAGQSTGQRSNLTVNHGHYFVDTTVSKDTQFDFACKYYQYPADKKPPCDFAPQYTLFEPGTEYDMFFLYARPDLGSSAPPPTKQDYRIYVGTDFQPDQDHLFGVRVNQGHDPAQVISRGPIPWTYDPPDSNGILTVHVDMSKLADFALEYKKTKMNHCAPATYCKWNGDENTGSCGCAHAGDKECDVACSWAGKDVNCPESDSSGGGGCYGFGFKLPTGFVADDSGATKAAISAKCLTKADSDWTTQFNQKFTNPNPNECDYSNANIPDSFCSTARPKLGARIGGLTQ